MHKPHDSQRKATLRALKSMNLIRKGGREGELVDIR